MDFKVIFRLELYLSKRKKMNNSPCFSDSQPGENLEISKSHALPYNLYALTRLSFSTAIFISTLLTIPDAVAIYPSTPEAGILIVRITGIWLSVFIQWQIAFLGILLLFSAIAGPVVVRKEGIKLWRFGKMVEWGNIEGITCERAPLLFRVLPFLQSASRLNIFVKGSKRLSIRNLDSLYFSDCEFDKLFEILSVKAFNMRPNSQRVFLFKPEIQSPLASSYKTMTLKRGIISSYIFVILVLFLGSQTLKYYLYNASAIDMNEKDLAAAKHKLEYATRIDSGFAVAWDRLARVSYRMKDYKEAEKYWKKALECKPGLVTSRVGLSSIYIHNSEFKKAERILNSVVQSNPRNIPALLNLAQVNFKVGKLKQAEKLLNQAVELSGKDSTVCNAALSLYKASIKNQSGDSREQ